MGEDNLPATSYLSLLGRTGSWAYCKDLAKVFSQYVMSCADTCQVGGTVNILGKGKQEGLALLFHRLYDL